LTRSISLGILINNAFLRNSCFWSWNVHNYFSRYNLYQSSEVIYLVVLQWMLSSYYTACTKMWEMEVGKLIYLIPHTYVTNKMC